MPNATFWALHAALMAAAAAILLVARMAFGAFLAPEDTGAAAAA